MLLQDVIKPHLSQANKKKTTWSAWKFFDDVTEAFARLMNVPTLNIPDYVMPTLERFVVLMYDRSSTCTTEE